VSALADRLQAATCQRLRIGDNDIDVSASVGLVVAHPGGQDDAEELLQAVDEAMHTAKAHGRGRVELYTDDLKDRAQARAQLYRELQAALQADEFVLHFQPIVAPDAGGIHAIEALIRWQHPTRGLLGPGEFLDLAESTGLIVAMGAWVLEAACEQGQSLHEAGLPLAVTVNLSAKQLNDPRTVDVIAQVLTRTGFQPSSLIIELTETSMVDDTDLALASMRAIKALGVQLAVDDFGTGYSSMAYIRRYPIDGIKIDRSFVRDMLGNSDDRAIVSSLIKLARDLDLWVIAEGIETPEQLQVLREMGCELIQGFLYARPMPAHMLVESARQLSVRDAVCLPDQPSLPCQRQPADVPEGLRDRIVDLSAQGLSLQTLAAALNAEGSRTPQGLRWHPRSVARVLAAADGPDERRPQARPSPAPRPCTCGAARASVAGQDGTGGRGRSLTSVARPPARR
jgi:EAL domain-containing protein (putative c-di-GMP-specific phosphodiesterase class I)